MSTHTTVKKDKIYTKVSSKKGDELSCLHLKTVSNQYRHWN